MRTALVVLAAGTFLAACSSDNSTGPDSRTCTKGTVSAPGTATGHIGQASCFRWDYAYSSPYTGDSVYSNSYDVALVKGQGYVFNLQAQDQTSDWDAVLELVGTNNTTGDVDLLAISDDEGVPGTGWSQMFFIAPASGVYSLRVSGYDASDTSDYVLTSKTCQPGLPPISDSLVATEQTLTTFDCVLEQPFYNYFGSEDSSYTKFYTLHFNPNDTKRITITYQDFFPAFQIFGPDWGVYCYYDYQGCGGDATNYGGEIKVGDRKVGAGGSSSVSLTITADGAYYCRSFSGFCGYNNFPGDYTIAVGAENFGDVGTFSITVEPENFESDVQTVVRNKQVVIPAFNPVLNHLRVKPQKLHPRVRRTAAGH